MKKFCSLFKCQHASSAKVVDGTLILSLPGALSPVVWRMDLGHVRSSALEVREGKNDTYVLTLKTPKDDVHDIAPFATRDQAVKALMAVSRALNDAHGQIRPAAVAVEAQTPPRKGSAGKWLTAIAGIALLLFLINFLMTMAPSTQSFSSLDPAATPMGAAPAGSPGVPMSADDFLRTR